MTTRLAWFRSAGRSLPDLAARRAPLRRGLWRTLLLWQERAANRARLALLDERDLRDMRMTRAQARHEAAKPFWRA